MVFVCDDIKEMAFVDDTILRDWEVTIDDERGSSVFEYAIVCIFELD